MKHRLFVMIGAACLMASTYQVAVDGQAPTSAATRVLISAGTRGTRF